MNRSKKPRSSRLKQASKPKPLTHEHKALLKAMKKGAKSHIINSLLTSFVRSVRESIHPRFFFAQTLLLRRSVSTKTSGT